MDKYDLQPIELGSAALGPVAALLRTAFPHALHFTEAVLGWQYLENPVGAAVGFNAWYEAALAGHYVALPMVALVNGNRERGLLSLNTATHPAHQGKGLFTQLAKATYEQATRDGYGFVVGVANANSTPGFLGKLGFHLVSPLRAMIGAGSLPVSKASAPALFEPLWDSASLGWRLSHPAHTYTCKRCKSGTMVVSERRQFGARYILGLLDPGTLPESLPVERGSVTGKMWIGLDPGMDWRGRAYVNIPMRFRPSPLNLIFKDLTGAGRFLDPAKVRFEAIDFDIL